MLSLELNAWQLFFRLARRLQKFPEATQRELAALRPLVEIYCEELIALDVQCDRFDFADYEACWVEFVAGWDAVRFPEGAGTLDIAAKAALEDPVTLHLPIDLGPRFQRLVSIVYHMGRLRDVFFLTQTHLARIVDCDQPNVSKMLSQARKYELLIVVRESSYKHHRSTEYSLGPGFARYAKIRSIEQRRQALNAQSESLRQEIDQKPRSLVEEWRRALKKKEMGDS